MITSSITDRNEKHVVKCLECGYKEEKRNRHKAAKAKQWHLKTNECSRSSVNYGPKSMIQEKEQNQQLTKGYLVEENQKERIREKAAKSNKDPGQLFRESLDKGIKQV